MNIYISADIEGVAGIAHWDETDKSMPDFAGFAEQMTREVNAACEGANSAGAEEIWIKDAHESGRNLIAANLPKNTKLIRGWSGHPLSMLQELNRSFYAVIFIGYHSAAGSICSPISHTYSKELAMIKINGEVAGECMINAYAASMAGVPVFFVSGDQGACDEALELNKNIKTAAVNQGIGGSVIGIHPSASVKKIREGVKSALKKNPEIYKIPLPENFQVEMIFKNHIMAYKASFYPGMKKAGNESTIFESADYMEILRMFLFVLNP